MWKKVLVVAVGTVTWAAGIAAIPAAPAYADDGYFFRPCALPALSGPGIEGNGCDVYGAPQWVGATPGSMSDQLINIPHLHSPQPLNKYMDDCGKGAAFAVVVAVLTDTEAMERKAFIGCAKSAAKAAGMDFLNGVGN